MFGGNRARRLKILFGDRGVEFAEATYVARTRSVHAVAKKEKESRTKKK